MRAGVAVLFAEAASGQGEAGWDAMSIAAASLRTVKEMEAPLLPLTCKERISGKGARAPGGSIERID
jgi:hypothetical protein